MGPVGDWAGATVGSPYARRQNVSRTQKAPLLNLAIHDLILLSFSMFDFFLSGLLLLKGPITVRPSCKIKRVDCRRLQTKFSSMLVGKSQLKSVT